MTVSTAAGDRARGFVPPVLAIPAVVGIALLILPLAALVARVEWPTLWTASRLLPPSTLSFSPCGPLHSRRSSASRWACRSPS